MKAEMRNRLFACLIALYPKEFRRQFGASMLETMHEAAAEFGVGWLMRDGVAGLARHYWTRPWRGEPNIAPYCAAGLRSGVYPFIEPVEFLPAKLLLATMLSSALSLVLGSF